MSTRSHTPRSLINARASSLFHFPSLTAFVFGSFSLVRLPIHFGHNCSPVLGPPCHLSHHSYLHVQVLEEERTHQQ
jgi:hypothetical protein